ncbi:MAG: PstS family phosphate ABC transporter substrate-binding protein [Leptolyngbyaceae bacterium]|nr:PstS family phosphate ABC transporter substrate-binding protein [Leptolyngbyaceae bacterium]
MNLRTRPRLIGFGILALMGVISAVMSSCAPSQPQAPRVIQIDGSSTVFPITDAIAKDYNQANKDDVQVQVGFSGTTGGFRKFCAGETDINNASRPISAEEMAACKTAGISYMELPVAFDALTVVVNPKNEWAKDITVEELKKIWEPSAQGKITNWQQIRPSYPNKPLKLFGPGKDSGTFDYFTEVTNGKTGVSRTDYTSSEDDNVLVQGISQEPNALAYFGFAYYEANQSQLKALPVNNGQGAVLPSRQAVEKAQYRPYARPLFIYVKAASVQKPEVHAFVEYYLKNSQRLASSVGYIPLPDDGSQVIYVRFNKGIVGTVFDGLPQPNLTIQELLRKQAVF